MTGGRSREAYWEDLSKWYACSHSELLTTKPEDLFESHFAERYTQLHQRLWWQVIHLHEALLTLEQLRAAPLDDLYAPQQMEFWHVVIRNLLDAACLRLHSLVKPPAADEHNLHSFRDEIMKASWRSENRKQVLRKTLRELRFLQGCKHIVERVKAVRNRRVAHQLRQSVSEPLAPEFVSLDDLWELFDAAHAYFGALTFGANCATLAGDLIPTRHGGEVSRSCFDKVIDAILKDNWLVSLPEKNPQKWARMKQRRGEGFVAKVNAWRQRVGLREA